MKAQAVCAAGAIGAFVLTVAVGWYDGVDFLMRGKEQVFWTSEAMLAAVAAYLFTRLKFMPALPVLASRWVRYVATCFAFVIVFVEAWYGGANPLQRGHGQGAIIYIAVAVASVCWACPLWTTIGSTATNRAS